MKLWVLPVGDLKINIVIAFTLIVQVASSNAHTVHTARQIPTGTSNSRCLCQRVRFGG